MTTACLAITETHFAD